MVCNVWLGYDVPAYIFFKFLRFVRNQDHLMISLNCLKIDVFSKLPISYTQTIWLTSEFPIFTKLSFPATDAVFFSFQRLNYNNI